MIPRDLARIAQKHKKKHRADGCLNMCFYVFFEDTDFRESPITDIVRLADGDGRFFLYLFILIDISSCYRVDNDITITVHNHFAIMKKANYGLFMTFFSICHHFTLSPHIDNPFHTA